MYFLTGMKTLGIITALFLAASAFAQDGAAPPTKFVTQVLEPTGGKITRPKDWFYTQSERGPSYIGLFIIYVIFIFSQ